ncbi:hypothetical protein KTH_52680 [Thermosporothrix hazakensis]|nr:hypothetical protein KTH_52680 [Thermosporothrix hazakensis]
MLSPHFSVLGWLLPSSMRIEFELSWSRLCRQNQERKNHLRGPGPVDDAKRYSRRTLGTMLAFQDRHGT